MKVTVLVENSKGGNALKAAHGLALYIEIEQYKILFDIGPSNVVIHNSDKIGISLNAIDAVALSHGHIDHTGGLESFRKVNNSASVYMHSEARNRLRYRLNKLISLPVHNCQIIKRNPTLEPIIQIDNCTKINEFCTLYCNFQKDGNLPPGNRGLEIAKEEWEVDSFDHELALHIQYKGTNILFTGCSHNGVSNIMESVKEQAEISSFDYVIGGFHLYDPVKRTFDKGEYFDELNNYIGQESSTTFYTGHCTGKEALALLRNNHEQRVESLYTGKIIEINP